MNAPPTDMLEKLTATASRKGLPPSYHGQELLVLGNLALLTTLYSRASAMVDNQSQDPRAHRKSKCAFIYPIKLPSITVRLRIKPGRCR